MPEPISIEKQFENYLLRVKLDRSKMTRTQYDETKKAFYAGASAMIVLFGDAIPALSDKDAFAAMTRLQQEASFFWQINLM